MDSENSRKSTLLFEKGMSLYNDKNYEEALKYFEASNKLCESPSTQIYINTCRRVINQKKQQYYSNYNSSNNNSSYNNSTNYNTTSNNNNSNNDDNTSSNKSSGPKTSEDLECEKILREKDFYKVLQIEKSATPEEIKKAYKKMAIKFHPDKNHSSKAEETFKKISQAYQILSDKDKRDFYDNHGGTEEEIRAQYQARYHQNYYDEDLDPFDVFEMFFGPGFGGPNVRRQRRGPHRTYHYQTEPIQFNTRTTKLMQLFPLIMIFITFILPNLFEYLKPKPLYQFTKDAYYQNKRKTMANQIIYYANEDFISKYPKMIDVKKSGIELEIEREYLDYIGDKCQNMLRYKEQLELRLRYMRYNNIYQREIKNELNSLNLESCTRYRELRNKIR